MIEILLILILLCLFKPIRQLIGIVMLIVIGASAYGHFVNPQPAEKATVIQAAPIENGPMSPRL